MKYLLIMKVFKKPIFTGFAPNLTLTDLKLACVFLFLPWYWPKWRKGEYPAKVENKLKEYFGVEKAFVFDSGRSALYFALKSFNLKEGDEVLIQTFTCVVVVNAIKWAGLKPIYVDIGRDFNLDVEDLRKKNTTKSRVLIIQHTFGKPADLNKLISFAKDNNLLIIEDCAHSLGTKFNDQLLGTFGDIGMLSFGSDKVLSCVRGGALITNNKNLAAKIKELQNQLLDSTKLKTFQHLTHYPIFAATKPIYNWGVGKLMLALAKKLNLFNKIIYSKEKIGLPVNFYPAKFPNALASILYHKFIILDEVIKHQQKIAALYHESIVNSKIIKPEWTTESIWLRYTVLVTNPQKLLHLAKREGIILGNWYNSPIAPADVNLKKMDYQIGVCPHDEKIALRCLNLPTDININEQEVKRIIELLNKYA